MTSCDDRPMTMMDWFVTLFVLAIPLVNVVLYLVWACGVGNRNRVNFCRASLLWVLIGVVFYVLMFSAAGFGTVWMQGR